MCLTHSTLYGREQINLIEYDHSQGVVSARRIMAFLDIEDATEPHRTESEILPVPSPPLSGGNGTHVSSIIVSLVEEPRAPGRYHSFTTLLVLGLPNRRYLFSHNINA